MNMIKMSSPLNHQLSGSAECGHAQTAHVGQPCFCGCPRYVVYRPEPAPAGDAPVERFVVFMYEHLSNADCNQLIASIADAKGVPFPGTLHDARQGFIIENVTRRETERLSIGVGASQERQRGAGSTADSVGLRLGGAMSSVLASAMALRYDAIAA
jgi:hypothetical protein